MEKLNNLATSVMNQWPGVRVRVTEGWDEDNHHGIHSLHYEGRAVDITTSDKDRSKYGLLAGLAVEAGFDWVYYESRSHIHCSVKSDSPLTRSGGCFTGNSTVLVEGGVRRRLSELQVGDRVLSLDKATGRMVYSEVILFLDRDESRWRQFLSVETSSGETVRVTPSHLVLRKTLSGVLESVFAGKLAPGDVLMVGSGKNLIETSVERVSVVADQGVFAPLTQTGTIIVDGVLASCYAVVESQSLAHYAFAPVRIYTNAKHSFHTQVGVHWYAKFLYDLSDYVLPSGMIYRRS
ncbi:hypothetical protein AAG570_010655 [Ranatra chinensis]|uniref:Protein hedgehog n=1 Tax=Ranatra chinensis TaxID=642074 RepID=A0ABD0Z595_9HEMI